MTGVDWYRLQFSNEPVMTGYDWFFAVFFSFSLVIWEFPFIVNRSRSQFSQKRQKNRTGPDLEALPVILLPTIVRWVEQMGTH